MTIIVTFDPNFRVRQVKENQRRFDMDKELAAIICLPSEAESGDDRTSVVIEQWLSGYQRSELGPAAYPLFGQAAIFIKERM